MDTGSGGISGMMYVLRGTAKRAERDDHPDLARMFPPATIKQARRRLVLVWVLCLSWAAGFALEALFAIALFLVPIGMLVALATRFEPAWIGSPIRRWTAWAVPVGIAGVVAAIVALSR